MRGCSFWPSSMTICRRSGGSRFRKARLITPTETTIVSLDSVSDLEISLNFRLT